MADFICRICSHVGAGLANGLAVAVTEPGSVLVVDPGSVEVPGPRPGPVQVPGLGVVLGPVPELVGTLSPKTEFICFGFFH